MKALIKFVFLITAGILISCGGKEEKKTKKFEYNQQPATEKTVEQPAAASELPASKRASLDNKGVGKVKHVELNPTIDEAMAARGAELFKTNCTACHKPNKRFIGPSPAGILELRTPEWVMNMILDPKLMTEQDPIAKALLVEFNGAAMANQNLTEAQARDILEYFRTLK
ncbi:c-type cytochrome [Tamlana sp. I1]|uniref:c-type cytochrome n=1 Tax=Tamlana sp. I1 TaxID=2762061 RepID=UPI00188F9429|nr:cytochrome c [Tamlana sp. I1]